jgi:hypothetical protein
MGRSPPRIMKMGSVAQWRGREIEIEEFVVG